MTDTMTRAEWKALKPKTAKQAWRANRPPRPPVDAKRIWSDWRNVIIGGIILLALLVGGIIYATGTHYSAADGQYLADIHASGTGAPVEAAQVPNSVLLHIGHQWCSDLEAGSTVTGIENGSLLAGYGASLNGAIAVNATGDLCPQYTKSLNSWINSNTSNSGNSGNTGNS